MNLRAAVAAGFLLNALLGPWCMAALPPVQEDTHAQHAHHAHCDDCDHHDGGASDDGCLGHCLEQAKGVSPAGAVIVPPDAGDARVFASIDVLARAAVSAFAQPDDVHPHIRPPGSVVLLL